MFEWWQVLIIIAFFFACKWISRIIVFAVVMKIVGNVIESLKQQGEQLRKQWESKGEKEDG